MKRIFNTGNFSQGMHVFLLLSRVAIALMMLNHGWGKWLKLTGDAPIKFADPIGLGQYTSLVLVVFSEVFCSILLFAGLFTRLAAVPLIITMLVAFFITHAGDPFEDREMAFHFLLWYVLFLVAGPGKYAVDDVIFKKMALK